MAQTYAFQVSLPVTDLLPRNRCVNRFHMEHVAGGVLGADLEDMCEAIAALYQSKYGAANKEIDVRAYDTDAVPNYPRAQVVVSQGTPWLIHSPREIALCLSYSGPNRGNKNERGRMYLMPHLNALQSGIEERPDNGQLNWALDWYREANDSLPDLGGVDWKFGVHSRTLGNFRQSTQAWVNDDWDVQRKRGLREAGRLSVTREG
jgi:hypothetical protein